MEFPFQGEILLKVDILQRVQFFPQIEKLIMLNKKWAVQVILERCQDKELLELAKKSGCVYLFLGLESFSEITLKDVNKSINNVDRYKEIISLIHKNGICIQAGIIFGFDTYTKDVFKETLEACNNLGIDGVTVNILTPLPRTPLYEQCELQPLIEVVASCFLEHSLTLGLMRSSQA